ncbi:MULTISPECIES: hypothetical protein [Pseudomonas]|jgi:hypothetical protein|uniref:Uncharacterized protein n=1 Tax=Pseudomonas fluorescens LMG 5329 TaxID=1324332 RepID=A0A0A1Z3D6_PSEFL|nr:MULTISPECIES: hypothetical protein [Pseudomonas]KGE68795.1 hypothetical protein K814_0106330 [Pseudomonas fluorescens LMG 5329]NWE05012.1 hypothetical protein [Pseudomonas sp. IPO3749]NWF24612.1 hypothetical protein [Pseudomonas sp. IPO3749]
MRLVWELLRVAWAVGCLPVGALLLVMMVFSGFNLPFFLGFTSGEDPALRWLFWVLILYFIGGIWLFSRINQSYAQKLRRIVAGYQADGFHPEVEVFAKINDAYVGLDLQSNRLLAYPLGQNGHLFRLDEIRSWRILAGGKSSYRLELLTSDLAIPTFSLALKAADVTSTEARLRAVFGI